MHNYESRRKKSLLYSIFDGSCYSMMVGFGELFFPVIAVFLKASPLEVGVISSLPIMIGYTSQLLANRFVKKGRKLFVNRTVVLQSLVFLPMIILLAWHKLPIFWFIFLVCLYWVAGMINVPAWNSWMGDLVQETDRGRYFGLRNVITGLINFISFTAAGLFLQYWSDPLSGFVIILTIAMIARFFSFLFLQLKVEPTDFKLDDIHFLDFWRASPVSFKRFIIMQGLMNGALFIAGPYFAPYMLRTLKLDYQTFTILTAALFLAKHLSMPLWGRLIDRKSAHWVMVLGAFLLAINPLFWLFSANFWYLIIAQLFAGVVWANFELSSSIHMYDVTTRGSRPTAVAIFNTVNGTAMFIGSMLGALLLHGEAQWQYYLVFALSGAARLLSALYYRRSQFF